MLLVASGGLVLSNRYLTGGSKRTDKMGSAGERERAWCIGSKERKNKGLQKERERERMVYQ